MIDASGAAERDEIESARTIAVICGPTAAGKSAVGMWLASGSPSTIVSADSRQVYRGFDVGTAKPSVEEQTRVPHQGIDVAEPRARYSAAMWSESADRWLAEAIEAGRRPLVVGGTGLYIRALFEGLFEEPELDETRRAAIAAWLESCDLPTLHRWTATLDPARAHLGRTQLLRAVEIALLTGQRLSDLHRARARKSRWRARYLLVDPGPVLAERIAARIDDMFDHGWPDEVRRLMQTLPANAPAWKATGYETVRRFVSGELSRAAAHEAILIATRQYAKRQRTWFRHQLPADSVTRLDPTADDWQATAQAWLESIA